MWTLRMLVAKGQSYSTSPEMQEPWMVELEKGQKLGTQILPDSRKKQEYFIAHLID